MPGLSKKVLSLKLEAAIALRHACWWEKQIALHGEEKATAFYKSLGLNHIEEERAAAAKRFTEAAIFGTVPAVATVVTGRAQAGNPFKITITHQEDKNEPKFITAHLCDDTKSFQWAGLNLSREPKEHEKLAVKGIHDAQESAKEKIGSILLDLRTELISDGLKGIKKLSPAKYHQLVLEAPAEFRTSLRDRLIKVWKLGRQLLAQELERQQGKAWIAEGTWQHPVDFDVVHKRNGFGPHDPECIGYECKCDIVHEPKCALKNGFPTCSCEFKEALPEDEFDLLDDLVDITDSRISNDVQSRLTAAATRFRLLGLEKAALWKAVEDEVRLGSVSYIDRASAGLAHKVINIGRSDEADDRKDSWGHVEYSALLDQNVCDSCASFDGETATDEADLEPTPSPSCFGADNCRCFHVFVQD